MSQIPGSSTFLLDDGAPHGEVVALFGGEHPRRAAASSRVAMIGTYLPRKCGIATFTADVVEQLRAHHPEFAIDVYALDNLTRALAYQGLAGKIAEQSAPDYARVARRINESGADVVWLQHEFGIFGGPDGAMVCDFVDRLAAPLVVTLHTVLTHPSENQRAIIDHLVRRASQVMVMSAHGRDLLVRNHHAPFGRVSLIPHGAPDRPFGREATFKRALGLADRPILMTFGLLGPGKGIERMIEALPEITARHPTVIYRVVGQVHPGLGKAGIAYRDGLHDLARRLGVADHVRWEETFLDTPDLLDQLEACDIYVTPYLNLQQSTSGTLSYAVALGKAVVATPYVHARELLADGAGVLVEPDSPAALATAVNRLLDDPDRLVATKRMAYARGRETIWPAFANASAAMMRKAVSPRLREAPLTATPGLAAVFAMSDGTGMLQHAIGPVPDRRHGYCLDDNARALMLMNLAGGPAPDVQARALTYASFIQHAWNPDVRRFRNFMAFDRQWCEDVGSDDSNGRALWALGHTVEHQGDPALRRWALEWFDRVAPEFASLDYPRTLAFAMLGAAAVTRAMGSHGEARRILGRGGDLLHRLLAASRRPDWTWFETMLGYDNPRLPQALIEAGHLLRRDDWRDAGIESLAWIAGQQRAVAGHFRPVGSDTFGHDFAAFPFDQQPLEAQAAIEAAWSAHTATGDARWREHGRIAWRWFFGGNDRGVSLVDLASGRCRDGVTPRAVNENCGAESILAFQLAYYTLVRLEGVGLQQPERHEGRSLEPASRNSSYTAAGSTAPHP